MPDKVTQQVIDAVLKGTAQALNQLADKVAADSLPEVPLEYGTLRASAVYPGNDPDGESTATEDNLEAQVSYNTVYAAAQHEGWALQQRSHPVVYIEGVGFRTLTEKFYPHEVVWVVKKYNEPGTKSHYLSDPFKAMVPRMEPFIGATIAQTLDKTSLKP
jgi:hypothetical protein